MEQDYLIAHGNEPLSAEGLSSVTEEYLEEKSYAATAFKMETNRALHATASKQGVIFTLKTSLEEERKQFSLYGLDVPDLVDPKCVEELQNWKGDHEPIAKGILTTRKVRPLHPETFKVEII
ncbi:hypothetical protein Pelo_18495 [Pelomyxa schiedti]|nr:hypothetical protein Pelo_18495 [Pelomyxa schiedti]